MAQIKIYGLREQLAPVKARFSEIVHECAMEALQLPREKRFHRFLLLEQDEFFFPEDRSARYTIIEISMFEGRSVESKKQLLRLLFTRLQEGLQLSPQDLEITIFETPRHNWGIRGQPGDELSLNYRVNV